MTRWFFIGFAAWILALPAHASPILADISSRNIEIHSAFTGTELLLFGARNEPGDIVVLVRGPSSNMVVRKKERALGVWVNRHQVTFSDMPQFYSVASSRPLDQVRQYQLFDALAITSDIPAQGHDLHYRDALKRLLQSDGLYVVAQDGIEFMGETLFKASINFPDNMPRGTYTAEAYLFNDGQLIGMRSIPIEVFKTGFDAFLYDASQHSSLLYGLIAVLLASSIGWFTSWLFQRL